MLHYFITFWLGYQFCKVLPDLKSRGFAAFFYWSNAFGGPEFEAFKKDAFSDIVKHKTQVPELLKTNSIRILEVGVGSGANFQFYPKGCHLIVVDPNPHFKSYYDNNRAKFPQIKSEEIILSTGEEMNMVADCSVDVVVISYVLCTVKNTRQFFDQVLRVLVPGGKFYFLEHIREWDGAQHRTKQMLQDWVTKYGIWQFIFEGCECNRETLEVIKGAGFSNVESKNVRAPFTRPAFLLVSPQLMGVATK